MYATISSTFAYALRILIVCVFKGMFYFHLLLIVKVYFRKLTVGYFSEEADPRRASAQKFEQILEELYNVYVFDHLEFSFIHCVPS